MTALLSEAVARPPVAAERWHDLDESLGANFLRVAAAFAERPALVGENWSATYAQLADAARSVSRALPAIPRSDAGDESPPRVALLVRHDTPLFAAALGALLAGYVVVTLNPTDPPKRLKQVIADAQPAVILVDGQNLALGEGIAPPSCAKVALDGVLAAGAGPLGLANAGDSSTGALRHPATESDGPFGPKETGAAEDLSFAHPAATASDRTAFIIYTSGSTGTPKGVVQTHRNILHNVRRLSRGMRITCDDRVALLSSISGGQGIASMCIALFNGAALCPFPTMERGMVGLENFLDAQRISIWVSAASLFRNFVRVLPAERRFESLRILRLASEVVMPVDYAAFERHTGGTCKFMQSLSSTETGNITQLFLRHGEHISTDAMPVGEAVEDVEILLLDDAGMPVAEGQVGEIAVRGRYLSPGYWRNPALTALRFAEAGAGMRLYRMGDLARCTPDGLFHAGRKDAQIKIRGYRIETAEIVTALERQVGVERAAVFAAAGATGTSQLAACVVARADATVEALRTALARELPSYMVPAIIAFVPALPLNAHGKIDLEALRARLIETGTPGGAAEPSELPDAGQTPTESLLMRLWQEIFPAAAVRRDADFFALGGDSLSAAVAAARLHAATGIALTLQTFWEHRALPDLAAHVDRLSGAAESPRQTWVMERASRDAPLPLSFTEERIWTICEAQRGGTGYTMSNAYRIVGALDVELFRTCLEMQFERHETLRTTYHAGHAGPVRRIQPPGRLALPVLDFSQDADPRGDAHTFLAAEALRPFDLSRLPLARFFLARVADNEHLLLRVSHHIMSDSWSWRLFFTELAALYEARAAGRTVPSREPALAYADYAAWQRRTLDRAGAAYRASVDWWAARFTPVPRPLALPFARRKPLRKADMSTGLLSFQLDAAVIENVDAYARGQGTTPFALRLAVLARLLTRQTGQRDIVIGSYVTNRQSVQTQQMFGDFANLATLRLAVDPAAPFDETLRTARDVIHGVQANSEIPYEQLRADLRARRPAVEMPEIRAILAISDRLAPLHFAGLEFSWRERIDTAPWGFTLAFASSGSDCRATFDPRLHDPDAVRAFVGQYLESLSEIVR